MVNSKTTKEDTDRRRAGTMETAEEGDRRFSQHLS